MIVAGEQVELCAERALYWPRERMLLVADPHFGKGAAFRSHGVYVPADTTTPALARLDVLVARHAPQRIVFLGDFLHAREGRTTDTLNAIARWRATHRAIDMEIVRGNHDRHAGDPPVHLAISCVDGPLSHPPFALSHHPERSALGYVLAGHLHPCAVLTGPGRQRERLPCFWFGADVGVLPAFGEFTGCADVRARPGDHVWVVSEDEVIKIPSHR